MSSSSSVGFSISKRKKLRNFRPQALYHDMQTRFAQFFQLFFLLDLKVTRNLAIEGGYGSQGLGVYIIGFRRVTSGFTAPIKTLFYVIHK